MSRSRPERSVYTSRFFRPFCLLGNVSRVPHRARSARVESGPVPRSVSGEESIVALCTEDTRAPRSGAHAGSDNNVPHAQSPADRCTLGGQREGERGTVVSFLLLELIHKDHTQGRGTRQERVVWTLTSKATSGPSFTAHLMASFLRGVHSPAGLLAAPPV